MTTTEPLSPVTASLKSKKGGAALILKVDTAIVDALTRHPGTMMEAITAAAHGTVDNARAKGWTATELTLLTNLFAERAAEMIAAAATNLHAERVSQRRHLRVV